MIKKYTFLTLIITSLFTTTSSALAEQNYNQFLTTYDSLLDSHIKATSRNGIEYNGVDYKSWSKDSRHSKAFSLLKMTNIDKVKNKKAFWINAYNFLTIELIIREKESESIKNLGTLVKSPWKRFSWKLAGKDYTLDYIEHKILRPLGDPAIHFAINCASVSCPDLRNESYKDDTLEQQLKEQTMLILNSKTKGLRIDGSTSYMSELFKWFAEDFHKGDVMAWLEKNYNQKLPKKVKYLDYDWSLNSNN